MSNLITGWETQIADYLNGQIDGLQTSQRYSGQFEVDPILLDTFARPALFIATTSWEKASVQPGDGRIALKVGFSAHIVTEKALHSTPENLAMDLALAVTTAVEGGRMGIRDAQVANLQQARLCLDESLNNAGLVRWEIRWDQVIYLGESQWPELEPVPLDLRFSHVPEVGFGHEQDYHRMAEELANV